MGKTIFQIYGMERPVNEFSEEFNGQIKEEDREQAGNFIKRGLLFKRNGDLEAPRLP